MQFSHSQTMLMQWSIARIGGGLPSCNLRCMSAVDYGSTPCKRAKLVNSKTGFGAIVLGINDDKTSEKKDFGRQILSGKEEFSNEELTILPANLFSNLPTHLFTKEQICDKHNSSKPDFDFTDKKYNKTAIFTPL